ncbi:hypothetical protein [Chryseobacterium sp.]|uniref:hypothetical protein n=1 Tax=Chryseobacterium sp. TaxID=1871047 RepID=UPI0025C449B1|nr:hypothetical protein [Chryseobacterium sp.]MBV8325211.1 hypothetical protein [Chryseobacterium sp.]
MSFNTNTIKNAAAASLSTNNIFLQSDCLYIQAAGSRGEESTVGIHLRWMLKGPAAEHLPKGGAYQGSPKGFNRQDDFVRISRIRYEPSITSLYLTSSPTTVIDSEALWLYSSGKRDGKMFYVYFRNTSKYNEVRAGINPFSDPSGFLDKYGSNLIEVESKDSLFFALQLTPATALGSAKTEVLSVETNKQNLPKNVTFRRDISDFTRKIFAENGRSVRFVPSGTIISRIDFEFYEDAYNREGWEELGKFALTTEDDEALYRLEPDAENHPVHATWPRYNDGEFVNIENYVSKWYDDKKDAENSIKDSVYKYLKLSDNYDNPLALDHYYPEDDTTKEPLEISHFSILQMAALDFHVARMLGLGHMDMTDEAFSGEQFMYAAYYVTEADLGNGQGPFEAIHVALTLPTSMTDQRLCLPVRLKQPVPGILSADPTAGVTMSSLTDANGYTYDGTARFLSLLTEEQTPDEPANSPFYYSSQQFDMSTFTYPVQVGIEYKSSDEAKWRLPELPHNPNYSNVDGSGYKAHFETVAIGLPDYGNPAYVHKEKRSGKRKFGSYGVNWFSRAQSASIVFEVESTIKPSNVLLPASSVNAFLIQEESPLLLTSDNEQQLYKLNTASDKTLVRLTMEYDAAQDMITYQKAINGEQITDFNPLPDAEEVFADHIEVFFRPEIPNRVFGAIDTITDLTGNPLVSVIKTKGFVLSSTGTAAQGTLQTLKPTIATAAFPNYIGGIFTVGTDDYIIHNILPGTNPDFPIFHVLKKQVGNAFGQNANIPFDPANFTVPHANDAFMVVENMQNPSTWGTVNPHPLKIQIGDGWPIHTEEKTIKSGQDPDVTMNTYFRKFRGIKKTAVVKRFIEYAPNPDPNGPAQVPLPFTGMYEIDFPGFTLNNHPQYSTDPQKDIVQWYRGSVRIEKSNANAPFEEKSTLKVVRIENINSGDLKLFALDESFATDPLQPDETIMPSRTVEVNFYPGYRAYLHYNGPCRLRNEDILPQNDDLEKYTIFGTRTVDLTYPDYKSRISTPTMMFGRKIVAPKTPEPPSGSSLYATRPDSFGRSSYAFTTEYKHKPFSVMFLRSNDDILLSSLYKHTKDYNAAPEKDSVEYIRERINDEYFNNRLSDLANAIFNGSTFKEYNGYALPIPNSEDLLKWINLFIQDHNQHYTPAIPQKTYNDIQDLSTVIIPKDPNGKFGELKFGDFVKQTIQNTYVPLTEIPVLYQYIKGNDYQPIPKAQVIRAKNGTLLTPGNDINGEFDMAPMMKIVSTAPHKTLFVDYTLDGASTSTYFYAARETNVQMVQSEMSTAIGPVKMVNSFPLKTPEIKSVIPVLEDKAADVKPQMKVTINAYNKVYNVKKAKLYRALTMQDAVSVRTMELVHELVLEKEGVSDDNSWTLTDPFHDLVQVPFTDPLYYRVTVEAEVEYSEAKYAANQPEVVVKEFAPSEASKIMITTMVENVLPQAPELKFESNPITGNVVTSGLLEWKEQCYKGKYHLYQMTNQGNWKEVARMNILPNNTSKVQLYLFENDPQTNTDTWMPKEIFDITDKTIFLRLQKLGLDPLTVKDADGNPIYYHFKVVTENTAGMFSKEDKVLTMYSPDSSTTIGGISFDGTQGMIVEQTFIVNPN